MAACAVKAVAPVWEGKLKNKRYRNWLKVCYALSITCEGAHPYVEKEIANFHASLLTKLVAAPICTCPPLARAGHTKGCVWARELTGHHRRGKPLWQQSDSTKWTDPVHGQWEVAKLYMPSLGVHVAACVNAATTDPTGLLNLLYWCDVFKVQQVLVDAVRITRNNCMHAPSQELQDVQVQDAFTSLKNFLQDPELQPDPIAQHALLKIQKLETDDMISFDEIELKVLKDLIYSSKKDTDDKLNKLNKAQEETGQKLDELRHEVDSKVCMGDVNSTDRQRKIFMSLSRVFPFLLSCILTTISQVAHSNLSKRLLAFCLFMCLAYVLDEGTSDKGCNAIPHLVKHLHLQEFDFLDQLASSRHDFTGRQWLLGKLLNTMDENKISKGVIITGDPGSGKSSFVANIICSQLSNNSMHSHILGYHMCIQSHRNTKDPAKLVRNLAAMIASRIQEYSDLISRDPFIQKTLDTCEHDSPGCFDTAVLTPLRHLKDSPPKEMFLIVDALDECVTSNAKQNDIADLFSKKMDRIPFWVKVIFTSQNVPMVLQEFSQLPIIEIKKDDPRNLRDIEEYVARTLYEQSSYLSRLMTYLSSDFQHSISSLVELSEGNFLLIKLVLQYREIERVQMKDLPKSIHGVYHAYFKRHFTNEEFREVRKILEILIATYEPLPVKELFKILQNSDGLDYEYDFVPKVKKMSMFLSFSGADQKLKLFHSTLSEWLTSNITFGGPFYVSKTKGHEHLAEFYLTRLNDSEAIFDYKFGYNLACHICESQRSKQYKEMFLSVDSKLVNCTDGNTNLTALHLAASSSSNPDVIELLASHFVSMDSLDSSSRTPAFIAAVSGHDKVVESLWEKGANLFYVTSPLDTDIQQRSENPVKDCKQMMCGYSLLHAAAQGGHEDTVELLLSHNLRLDAESGAGNTPMQIAAENGHVSVMKILHRHGAKYDARLLRSATAGGHYYTVKFLLQVGVLDECIPRAYSISSNYMKQPSGQIFDDEYLWKCETALHIACSMDLPEIVGLLVHGNTSAINCPDYLGMLPIHKAVVHNSYSSLKKLLWAGVGSSLRCDKAYFDYPRKRVNDTTIHLEPCCCASTALHLAARHGLINIVRLLAENGADTSAVDVHGSQPIHVAACHGRAAVLSLFVNVYKVDVNSRDILGQTPFIYAVECKAENVFKRLVHLGADIFAVDKTGRSPIMLDALDDQKLIFKDPYVRNRADMVDSNLKEKLDSLIAEVVPKHSLSSSILKIYLKAKINASIIQSVFEMMSEEELSFLRKGKLVSCKLLATDIPLASSPIVLFSTTAMFISHVDSFIASLIKDRMRKEEVNKTGIIPYGRRPASSTCRMGNTTLNCSFLVSSVRKNYVYVADRLLSAGMDVNCRADVSGDTPLLTYLRNGGRNMAKVLAKHKVKAEIKCGEYFKDSVVHLSAYHKLHYLHYLDMFQESGDVFPLKKDDMFDYLLFDYERNLVDGKNVTVQVGDGPLIRAIKSHNLRKGYNVLNKCFDNEGFLPLHRAAQGGNLLAVKKFLDMGADLSLETEDGRSALSLAIQFAVKYRPHMNFHEPSIMTDVEIFLGSVTAKEIITQHIKQRKKEIKIGCNPKFTRLTLYHIAASRGMYHLIVLLLELQKTLPQIIRGLDEHCVTKHGITPYYLAFLNANVEHSSWKKTLSVIQMYSADMALTYRPKVTARYFLLFNTLFNTFPVDMLKISANPYDLNFLCRSKPETCSEYLPIVHFKRSPRGSLQKRLSDSAFSLIQFWKELKEYFDKEIDFFTKTWKFMVLFSGNYRCIKSNNARDIKRLINITTDKQKIPDMCTEQTRTLIEDVTRDYKIENKNFQDYYMSFLELLEEAKNLADEEDISALNKTMLCLWRDGTMRYIRLRFMAYTLDFMKKQIEKNWILPSMAPLMKKDLLSIQTNLTETELLDIVKILSEGTASEEFVYLGALQFPRPPLYRKSFTLK
ncbi:uncharacterized protein LOC116601501 [Nematostella vectensis]|uniref:uncharacterized protein LOC116601501 n=1 Tax=Nematostella vectensis TaxID=45351 RepID=UPI002077043B|nr:uncharacterized protein LOC116601501 [Nematostella vectensis]